MKVLYDFQTFALQQYGGISRYYYELIDSYTSSNDIKIDLGFNTTPNWYLLSNPELVKKYNLIPPVNDDLFPRINFRGKHKLNRIFGRGQYDCYRVGKELSIQKIEDADYDIFHPTYYDPYFLKANNKPYVLTVLDMTHEIYPEYFGHSERMRIADKRSSILAADRLIAISENTKKDVVDILGVDPDKVDVVYLCNTLGTDGIDDNLSLPKKYLYYVGNRWIYKNFLLFIEVFAGLVKENPDLFLVCSGGGNFSEEELLFFEYLGLEGRILHIGHTDEIVRTGYKHALAFIYCSLYEGFGVPILEAFALGCPVVCSNTSCFPEVGDEAATYFNPKDYKSMYSAISSVLKDLNKRRAFAKLGIEREKLFSKKLMIDSTQAVYEKMIRL